MMTLIQGNGRVRVKIQFNAQINFVFIKLNYVSISKGNRKCNIY